MGGDSCGVKESKVFSCVCPAHGEGVRWSMVQGGEGQVVHSPWED